MFGKCRYILLVLLFITLNVKSQDTAMINFCASNVGIKFGKDGPIDINKKCICFDFVWFALKDVYGIETYEIFVLRRLRTKRPKPGDIVVFDRANVMIGTQLHRVNHIGIVKEFKGSIMYYYEQNVTKGGKDPGSPVGIGFFDTDLCEMKRIYFISMKKIRKKYLQI